MKRCCGCCLFGVVLAAIIIPIAAMLVFEFTDCDLFNTTD